MSFPHSQMRGQQVKYESIGLGDSILFLTAIHSIHGTYTFFFVMGGYVLLHVLLNCRWYYCFNSQT